MAQLDAVTGATWRRGGIRWGAATRADRCSARAGPYAPVGRAGASGAVPAASLATRSRPARLMTAVPGWPRGLGRAWSAGRLPYRNRPGQLPGGGALGARQLRRAPVL